MYKLWITTKLNKVNFSLKRWFSGGGKAKYIVSGATLLFALFTTPAYAETLYMQTDQSTYFNKNGNFQILSDPIVLSTTYEFTGAVIHFSARNPSGFCNSGTYPDNETTQGSTWYVMLTDSDNNPSITWTFDTPVQNTWYTYTFTYAYTDPYQHTLPAGTYYLKSYMACNNGGLGIDFKGAGSEQIWGYLTDASGGGFPPDDTSTRIISVSPSNGSTHATSSSLTVGAEGWVNEDDFVDDTKLKINIKNNAQNAYNLVGPSFAVGETSVLPDQIVNKTFEWDITASDDFDLSTTTTITQIGVYTMRSEITVPRFTLFSWSFFPKTLVATTTQFKMGTSTSYDVMSDNINTSIANLFEEASSANCTIDWTTAFGVLDIGDCVKFLFVFSTENVWNTLNDILFSETGGLLRRAPWGYATRAVDIFFGDVASSTLPSIAISVPDNLPHGGETIDFTPYTHIQNALTRIDTTEVDTIDGSPLDQFIYYWELMWKIVFVLWLIREIHGAWESGDFEDLGFVGGDAHGRMRKDVHGRTYQEWSTKDIQRAINKGKNSNTFDNFGKMKGKSSNRHRY